MVTEQNHDQNTAQEIYKLRFSDELEDAVCSEMERKYSMKKHNSTNLHTRNKIFWSRGRPSRLDPNSLAAWQPLHANAERKCTPCSACSVPHIASLSPNKALKEPMTFYCGHACKLVPGVEYLEDHATSNLWAFSRETQEKREEGMTCIPLKYEWITAWFHGSFNLSGRLIVCIVLNSKCKIHCRAVIDLKNMSKRTWLTQWWTRKMEFADMNG
jgi:hypothetical protein